MITWKWVTIAATVFLACMTACAIIYESFALALIGFGISVPVVYISKTKAKSSGEVVEDELTWKISADSALTTIGLMLPAIAVLAIVLVIGSGSLGEWAEISGITMSMVVLAFGLMYTSISLYRGWKMGIE